MKKKPYLTPDSEIRIVELYSLLTDSITKNNNADAKNNRFYDDETDISTSPWSDETLK